ncbi:hypothetical protein O1L60_22310 [Streptomyces diastatochromogenes]|nr:hypothetical protein [Streptomyces diastatochromogenes]
MRWHRYADGTSVLLAKAWSVDPVLDTAAPSDIVPTRDGYDSKVLLHDMAAPAGTPPVVIDLAAGQPTPLAYVAAVGSTVVAQRYEDGKYAPLLLSRTNGTQTARAITGLPPGLTSFRVETADKDGVALVSYTSATAGGLALVDTRTAAVTETYARPAGQNAWDRPSFSATHVSWWEHTATTSALVVADRATKESRRFDFPDQARRTTLSAPLGDWALYGTYNTPGSSSPSDRLVPLTARSLKSGETVKLLDRVSSARVTGPDGTLYVQGGTVEHGEGLYRITVGPDGVPSARPAYSDGTPTALTLTGTGFGPSVVLDPLKGGPQFSWTLSHPGFAYDVTLTNKASGQKKTFRGTAGRSRTVDLTWYGGFDPAEGGLTGPWTPGAYTWKLDAVPSDGLGPDLHASGDFTLGYVHRAHDYNGNGTTDLFARDAAGKLWRADSRHAYTTWGTSPCRRAPRGRGHGLGRLRPDRVRRRCRGHGRGRCRRPRQDRRPLAAPGHRRRIETVPRAGEGRRGLADLRPARGRLRPDERRPRGSGRHRQGRRPVPLQGHGQRHRSLRAPQEDRFRLGRLQPAHRRREPRRRQGRDLLARDRAGVLWLYLGKGDGTFTTRTKIGAGWNQYSQIVGIDDNSNDGFSDVYVYGPDKTAYFYASSGGAWRMPLQARRASTLLLNSGTTTYDHVS